MATSGFTCITCRVIFIDAELQRAHYKTDWHRYNLKRKVAELPPVTAEDFQQRVLKQRVMAPAELENTVQVCRACKKHFTSENSYQSHLRSRKHKDKVLAAAIEKIEDGGLETEELDSLRNGKKQEEQGTKDTHTVDCNKDTDEIISDDEPEPLEITECLFCPHMSKDLESSLSHMSKSHGFFIPELEYLVDVKGMISYLCEKVGMGYMCLYCNTKGKGFYSVESVQQHMVDKCHCMLSFEEDDALEYAEFYDYTKRSKQQSNKEGEKDDDDNLSDSYLKVTDELDLVLPSGTKVGHRSMAYLYKQHLPTLEQRKAALLGRVMNQYRALGWKEQGSGQAVAVMRAERDKAWASKMQKARELKLGVKANKLQKHFRPQVVF